MTRCGLLLALLFAAVASLSPACADPIRVLVWDEQQEKQRTGGAYPNYLGNQIASYLEKNPSFEVQSTNIKEPEQGISSAALEACDVLVWWGHLGQNRVPDSKGKEIVRRVREGKLALVILHSAHFSTPFMEAMEQRAADDALGALSEKDRSRATVKFFEPRKRKKPARDQRPVIKTEYAVSADGKIEVRVERPHCVFYSCCDPVEPAKVRTLFPEHPIAAGIPETFVLPETEMYDEPFGVPVPDLVIFEESWEGGEHFRSGALWHLGQGNVFYFRPGHETYKVFFEKWPLKIVENACTWLGESVRASKA
jgi:trehalose utilization protein